MHDAGTGTDEPTSFAASQGCDPFQPVARAAALDVFDELNPLHSLWIDLLVLRLLNAPTAEQRPVWFVLDELASLQRLPQLHTAITENRKSKNPLILGFQGKAQLEMIYGHLAEVMLSQPATKIFLKTTEPKAAEWVSKAIGNIEIERMRETHVHGTREGKSFTIDRQTEPLVMDSEISGLADSRRSRLPSRRGHSRSTRSSAKTSDGAHSRCNQPGPRSRDLCQAQRL